MPDEKESAEPDQDLECQWYTEAARDSFAEKTQLETSLGLGHDDLSRELQHVSYAVQDFTGVVDTQRQGQAFAVIQSNTGTIPQGAQEKFGREQSAKVNPNRYRVEKALDPPTDTEQDSQDAAANAQRKVRGVDEPVANANVRGATLNANSSPLLSEILKQQGRVLQLSQNGTGNQIKAQAVIAQLSSRIDQLSAQQRQLQDNWRRMRMEDQNRTHQNMGGN